MAAIHPNSYDCNVCNSDSSVIYHLQHSRTLKAGYIIGNVTIPKLGPYIWQIDYSRIFK